MKLSYHNFNIDRVCIRYATNDDNGDELEGVMVRGLTEDILPILDAGVVNRIKAQIKAAKEFAEACQRQDEAVKICPKCNTLIIDGKCWCDLDKYILGGPDGPVADSCDGYKVDEEGESDAAERKQAARDLASDLAEDR
jgi:hypothetical protein